MHQENQDQMGVASKIVGMNGFGLTGDGCSSSSREAVVVSGGVLHCTALLLTMAITIAE